MKTLEIFIFAVLSIFIITSCEQQSGNTAVPQPTANALAVEMTQMDSIAILAQKDLCKMFRQQYRH